MPQNMQAIERLKFTVIWFNFYFIFGFVFSLLFSYYFKKLINWSIMIDNTLIIAVLLTLSCVLNQKWLYEYNNFKKIGKVKVTIVSLLIALYGLLFLTWQWFDYLESAWLYHTINLNTVILTKFFTMIMSVTDGNKIKIVTFIAISTLLLFGYLLAKANKASFQEKLSYIFICMIILIIQYFFNVFIFYLTVAVVFTLFFSNKSNYEDYFPKKKIFGYNDIHDSVCSLLYKLLDKFNNINGIICLIWVFFLITIIVFKLFSIFFTDWWQITGAISISIVVLGLTINKMQESLVSFSASAIYFAIVDNPSYYQRAIEALTYAHLPTNVNHSTNDTNIKLRTELVKAVQQYLPNIINPSFEINRVNEERATQQSQQSSPDTNNQAPKPSSPSKEAESTNSGDVRNPFPFDFESISTLSKKMAGVFTNKETYPENLTEKEVVQLAYNHEIQNIASVLKVRLSVLVSCDKLVVEHLWQAIIKESELKPIVLQVSDLNTQSSLLRGQLSLMRQQIETMKTGEVLVVPHLDLLAGGSTYLSEDAREFVELIYRASDHCILAFTDVSLDIPEVLAARFSTRKSINGVPRTVTLGAETILLGQAFITATEVKRIKDYDAEGLYKNISGMNPLQIRHAIVYAIQAYSGKSEMTMEQLYQSIRDFKAKTSSNFEIPDVSFDDIGGYDNVKAELSTAIELLEGTYRLSDEKLKKELIPRGFIFHGRPGTGKTLFAKAVANRLQATVMVVSGPETIDKWLGESERKVRELFAEARRNAPSVLIFDEFDAIAGKRTNSNDGGSRAINSMVAQILTEMDGFRPDVPMLVIGTTNRLDIIDDAFLRPSRFQAIAIDLPDKIARRSIAGIYAKKFQVTVSDEVLDAIAETTQGFNGDEMQAIFRNVLIDMVKSGNAQLPVQADPNRLGQLVGAMRRSKTEQHRGGVVTISLN